MCEKTGKLFSATVQLTRGDAYLRECFHLCCHYFVYTQVELRTVNIVVDKPLGKHNEPLMGIFCYN